MNNLNSKIGFYPADIMLPVDASDSEKMNKWSVVACDQFTSQPEYWEAVEKQVGAAPSTLRLILPEVKLGNPDVENDIKAINDNMKQYIDNGVFKTLESSMIYVERKQSDGRIRHGLIGMVDLEAYDFTPGSGALIRATEGTVLSRIPPRVKVRENAPIELPHVMLLIDDPDKKVIEPLTAAAKEMNKVYDFEMMQGGGHICGYSLSEEQKDEVAQALYSLTLAEEMDKKYGMKDASPLLFAVGDGNHSLATAKQCYENLKKVTPEDKWAELPARFALVEVVNNHDDALTFEPIHRTLFNTEPEKVLEAFLAFYPGSSRVVGGAQKNIPGAQYIEYNFEGESGTLVVPKPDKQLAVGTLQAFLDEFQKENPTEVDYIHGDEVVRELGNRPGNISFLLPAMGKEQLFKTVMADGVLPRKTFSMGHAQDKRYYTEARKIKTN